MVGPRHPSLYHVNTRLWLTEQARPLSRSAGLDGVRDSDLDRVICMG